VNLLYSLDAAAEERLFALFQENVEFFLLGFQGRYLLGRFEACAFGRGSGERDTSSAILADAGRAVNGNVIEMRCKTPPVHLLYTTRVLHEAEGSIIFQREVVRWLIVSV
jgi:hypothetical protein